TERNSNRPSSLDVVVSWTLVAVLVNTTVAPGIARPLGSTTVPEIDPDMLWAAAHPQPSAKKKRAKAAFVLPISCRLHKINQMSLTSPFHFNAATARSTAHHQCFVRSNRSSDRIRPAGARGQRALSGSRQGGWDPRRVSATVNENRDCL